MQPNLVSSPTEALVELLYHRHRWLIHRVMYAGPTALLSRYSPDSQLVAIACGDEAHGGAVYLWSRHTDEVSMVCRVNQAVLTIRFTAPSVHGRERIVTGAADGILRAFEQTEGGKRFHLMWQNAGHHKRVTEIAVSTSGRAIVSCSADGNAQIISAVDGNGGNSISRTLDHDVTQRHGITGARFRTDAGSTSFATCSEDRRVRVFDRDSGMLLAESVATAEPLRALCYVAGGSAVVAGGSDGTLHFFDVSMPESYESAQNESALTCAVVDPFGELVVTGDRDDVKFYDSFTGVFLARQVVDCEVLSLAFCAVGDPVPIMTSPTAAAANSVSDDAVDADARDNPPNHMIYVRTGVLVAVCAAEHGSRRTGSASGKIMIFKFDFQSHDGGYHTQGDLTFESAIKVALPGQHIAVVAHPSRPQFVVCTKMLGGAGTADFSNIALFDAIDGRRLWQSELTAVPVQSICFSPPGDAVVAATCDARLLLIRVSDGALVAGSPHRRGKKPAGPWEFNFLPPSVRQGAIQHGWEGVRRVLLAWAPTTTASAGNSLVAVAHSRPWLRPVSNGTGKFDDLVGWTRPDVHTVAVYNFGGTASVGGCTVQLAYSLVRHPEAIEACDFSTDGALLCTGCRDGFLRIFDSRQGHQLYCSLDHSGRVLTAQFFTYHDGDIGVITSSARGTWRLFLYDDYVRSTVALCTNLALQPAVSPMSLQVLQRAFCLFGRYAMAMNAKSCGGVFDLLFSRIPDGPNSFTFGLSQHSVPVMLRRERVCPAVVQIVRAWPYSTAADINLANGRGGRLRTAVDVILDMGKSSEAVRSVHPLSRLTSGGLFAV
jgi:WD40 repeat protein